MVNKAPVYILFLFVLISLQGISQEVTRKSFFFEKNLNYESFPKDSHGSRIIASLASSNITSLYWVKINVQGNLQVVIHQAEVGRLSANIILQDRVVSGESFFRDFGLDSILMPDIIEGTLSLFIGKRIISSQPWLIAFNSGHVQMFISDTVNIEIPQLRVELKVDRFNYSDQRYAQYAATATLINAYYSYHKVLTELVTRYQEDGLSRDQKPSQLFIAWEEICRVNHYAANYQFASRLNLDVYDPLDFITLFDQSVRLERRANTLKSWLAESGELNIFDDKEAFSRGFAGLSAQYLLRAMQHQPYIASGFSEAARMITGPEVTQMLEEASRLYDVFNKIEDASTLQKIYDYYIALADSALKQHEYVGALDLLYNASLMAEWFENTDKSPAYERIYSETIDGLMSSYLKVATMAFRNDSYFMAEKYYEKAMEVYRLHSGKLNGKKLASEAFLSFIRKQTEVTFKMIEDQEFFKAIAMLNKTKQIGVEQELAPDQTLLDSAYSISYSGLYDQKLDSVQRLVESNHVDDALMALESTNEFKKSNTYLQNVNQLHFKVLAEALYDLYLERGQRLMKGDESEKALFEFIKAKKVNDQYIHKSNQALDSLIYHATVPVILNIVQEAGFEVWANRMQHARDLLAEAIQLQQIYNQENNDELNLAIAGLKEKIENKHCVNISNALFALEKKIETKLKLKKYREAEALILEGKSLVGENKDCKIDADLINSLHSQYKAVFGYYALTDTLNASLVGADYEKAVKQFYIMLSYYQVENIQRFDIEQPDIYSFVKEHEEPELTRTVIYHLYENQQFEEAFKYLSVLKQQNLRPKDTKAIQELLGTALAGNGNLDSNIALSNVINGNDKWYRYFRKAYFKALKNT